jgi:hypothetical protein
MNKPEEATVIHILYLIIVLAPSSTPNIFSMSTHSSSVLPSGFVGDLSAVSDTRMREYEAAAGLCVPLPLDTILSPNPNRFVIFPIRYAEVSIVVVCTDGRREEGAL